MLFFDGFFKRLILLSATVLLPLGLWADAATDGAVAGQSAAAEPKKVSVLQTTPKMAEESRIVVYCLERMHYLRKPIKRLDPSEILDVYFNDLDPARLFFLKSDIDSLKARFTPTLDVFLQQGNLLPAFAVFQVYRDRVRERCEWVAERLKQPFDFSTEDTFRPDRKDAAWLDDTQQADVLWQQRLKFELLNETLASRRKKAEDNAADKTAAQKDGAVKMDDGEAVAESVATASNEAAEPKAKEEENKSTKPFEERLPNAIENLEKRYARFIKTTEDIDSAEVQEIYLNSVASVYDPHSAFLSPYFLDEFDISMRNSLVGIGAVLSDKDGMCTIRELIAGGPAERSGKIHAGDKIVGVAQDEDGEMVDVVGMKLRKTVRQIRGKKGTVVRLLVQPAEGDPSDRTIITLERDEIKLTDNLAQAQMIAVPDSSGETVQVGVIDLPTFYGPAQDEDRAGTSEDVKELIQTLKGNGMQALVLDLRRNGGGYLNEAIDLAGLFVAGGPVLQVRDTTGKVQELRDSMRNALAWNGPLVLLVSKMSASATEIVAGALQDHNRAVIIGDAKTHGKGTVQAVYPFENLIPKQKGAAKITTQKWYLPDGNSIQVKGIASDIVLPSSFDALPIGEGDLDRALPWDSIPSLILEPRAESGLLPGRVTTQLLSGLGDRSSLRQGSLQEFALLNEQVNWNRAAAQKKEFSLSRAQREKERADDTAMRERLSKELETMAGTLNYPSTEYKLAVAAGKKATPSLAELGAEAEGDENPEFAKKPVFDVRLREAARVAADWWSLSSAKPAEDKASVATKAPVVAEIVP